MCGSRLFCPSGTDELLAFLKGHDGPLSFVAGGTDWTIRRRADGIPHGAAVVDLSGVSGFRGISIRDGWLRIGAMETMSAVAKDAGLMAAARCLCEAAASVGLLQIRNSATLGGNLANASPAADTPIALAALDATAELLSPRGSRVLPVAEIPEGLNRTALAPDEAIAAFRIPLAPRRVSAFLKIGSRREVSIARLNIAASLVSRGGGTSDARVCIGTLGRAIRRAHAAEEILNASGFDGSDDFCDALVDLVERAIPGRHSLPYKRSAMRALGEDILAVLRRRVEAAE